MNYYEELDISPAASTDEIRHAYKSLARLLHPDQCPDENLKRLAELQMRRLNQILAVLTDPVERRQYDIRLKAPALAVRQKSGGVADASDGPWRRRLVVGLCAWLPPAALLVLLLATLVYYGSETRQFVTASTPRSDSENPPAAATALPQDTQLVTEPYNLPKRARPENVGEFVRLRSGAAILDTPAAGHQTVLDQLTLAPPPPTREQPAFDPSPVAWRSALETRPAPAPGRVDPSADRSAPYTFAGHWYYVPEDGQTSSKGIYLPQYIELHLSESGGILRGHYLARYRVTDRAIEPNVAFEFEGAGTVPTAQFLWNGPGEATGKVTLRLLSADRMEVNWIASSLSADLNLASGNAQLIRQKER